MPAYMLMLSPVPFGWAVVRTDGPELARFRGPWAKQRAMRYLFGSASGGGWLSAR